MAARQKNGPGQAPKSFPPGGNGTEESDLSIVVHKYGGTSLANADVRNKAIRHIEAALQHTRKLVVVVSAMGRSGDPYATDTLLRLGEAEGGKLKPRERDLLLSCGEIISAVILAGQLEKRGIRAGVLTGGQAGLLTNGQFGHARILSVDPQPVRRMLEEMPVAIVAGFQGRTPEGDVTTLGRGGSDTTAAALGTALQAARIDIFTDVPGLFTADPRLVSGARRLTRITYAEVCQMAHNGAKVIHPRAAELAMQAGIPLFIRSVHDEHDEGTRVTGAPEEQRTGGVEMEDRPVTAIGCITGLVQMRVSPREPRYDFQPEVFRLLAGRGISVDFVSMNPYGVLFTVFDREAGQAAALLAEHGLEPGMTKGCAKVAVIGGGMNGVPGIMATIVSALTARDIAILQSADSNTTIWVLVREEQAAEAVNALHEAFQLNREGTRQINRI